ncbi:MFS transporter [Jeongeupia naejangsanensis]|uniref:MFS transporter n=1 Tax=Jeongeupia naejangsanensis TaxID=613195 RepID=A0ABS2BGJ1_9NEIS|nr:MFS transporter [Jeongeupia naejangsanensis]MBM3114580.1 MFS transporter [Jeongeupia naejangsanensis]
MNAARDAGTSPRGFLLHFVLLAMLSGATIGTAKLVTTFYALHLGADAAQVGLISAMESLGMVLVTVPAGFLIARFGARRVYFIASLGPLLLNLLIPFTSVWYAIALTQLLIGLCIPFRIVSMNSAFLEHLKYAGSNRAGWYRAALVVGIGLCGPLAADLLGARLGHVGIFAVVAASFAVMAVYGHTFLPEARPSVEAPAGMIAGLRDMLRSPEIGNSCLIEVLAGATNALYGTFIVVVALQSLHMSKAEALQLVMVQGATSVLWLLGLGRVVGTLGARRVYPASIVSASAGLALLGLGGGFVPLAVGAVLMSLGAAMIHLLNMGQLSRHRMDKSRISGLFNLASMAGAFAGAMAGSVLNRWLPMQQVFLAWIPLVLLTAVACRLHAGRHAARVRLNASGA